MGVTHVPAADDDPFIPRPGRSRSIANRGRNPRHQLLGVVVHLGTPRQLYNRAGLGGRHGRYLDIEDNPHIPPPIVCQELEEVAQRRHGLGPKVADGAEGLEVGPVAVAYELVDAEAALKAGVLFHGEVRSRSSAVTLALTRVRWG